MIQDNDHSIIIIIILATLRNSPLYHLAADHNFAANVNSLKVTDF